MSRKRSFLVLGAALALGVMGCADVAAPSRGSSPTPQGPQAVLPVQPTWTVADLGTLPGHTQAIAHDLNQHIAVGASYLTNPLADGIAVWWDSAGAGGPNPLGMPPGGIAAEARAINASGQIVGEFVNGATTRGFFRSVGGAFAILSGPPGATVSHAYDISDLGTVVGSYVLGGTERAYRYTPSSGYVDLHPPGMASSLALGVNNQGNVVGWVFTTTNEFHAALWDTSGNFTDLGGAGVPLFGFATDINANDNVVGYMDSPPTGFAQNISGVMVTLTGMYQAGAISSRNRIVGKRSAMEPATMLGLSGAVTALPMLPGNTNSSAKGVNACGHAVGYSYVNNLYRATAWRISACD